MSVRMVMFGDISEFKYGKAPSAQVRKNGDVAVFGSNGQVGTHDVPLSTGPTIIIGRKGSVGEVHYCERPNWPIDTTYYIDQSATECHLRWLAYALKASRIRTLNKAAAVPGLNRNDAYLERVALPPLDEQKRIAATLDKADALRAKRRQAIALLDSLTQSIFLEMFGDPVINPKGWKYQALEDIVEAVVDCPHSTPNWVSSGKIALRTSNLTKGGWDWSDTRYVTDSEFVERSRRRAVKSRDIVLSREGTVGIAAIVAPDMEVCLGQRLVQIAPDEQRAVSEYLLQHLLFNLAPDRISHVMVGATSQHINVKDLRKLKIMIPSLQSQMEFKSRHDLLSGRLEAVLASAAETGSLFASLQHRAFTGQL